MIDLGFRSKLKLLSVWTRNVNELNQKLKLMVEAPKYVIYVNSYLLKL